MGGATVAAKPMAGPSWLSEWIPSLSAAEGRAQKTVAVAAEEVDDYGIFNNITHDIGTHVVHHLFPQIPHYNLTRATDACKGVMGKYYREPKKARFGIPTHLFACLAKSFRNDSFVEDDGNVLFYKSLEQL